MSAKLKLEDIAIIAENDCGWAFGVGRMGGRWLGFACETAFGRAARQAFASEGLPTEPGMLFFLNEVSEGIELGVVERARAVLLTGAVAQDPESSYGGVDRWHVPEAERGQPAALRCPLCGRIGCTGTTCWGDYATVEAWINSAPGVIP